jgi:hypothetical protein
LGTKYLTAKLLGGMEGFSDLLYINIKEIGGKPFPIEIFCKNLQKISIGKGFPITPKLNNKIFQENFLKRGSKGVWGAGVKYQGSIGANGQ